MRVVNGQVDHEHLRVLVDVAALAQDVLELRARRTRDGSFASSLTSSCVRAEGILTRRRVTTARVTCARIAASLAPAGRCRLVLLRRVSIRTCGSNTPPAHAFFYDGRRARSWTSARRAGRGRSTAAARARRGTGHLECRVVQRHIRHQRLGRGVVRVAGRLHVAGRVVPSGEGGGRRGGGGRGGGSVRNRRRELERAGRHGGARPRARGSARRRDGESSSRRERGGRGDDRRRAARALTGSR